MLPDVYYYNPTCELAVANGSENFMPNTLLRQMEYDLDFIPACLAKQNDFILLRKYPGKEFIDRLSGLGFFCSQLLTMEEALKNNDFISRPKNFLLPWGWSPEAHKRLSFLKNSCSDDFKNSPVYQWTPLHKDLFSRKQGLELLKSITDGSDYHWMLSAEDMAEICFTHEQIQSLQKKWRNVVVKSPWSSSGRGLQVLRHGEYNRSNRQVISGYLNQQGYVLAGPWHNKLLDLSFQFYSDGKGNIEFKGLCSFETDKAGRYIGGNIEELPLETPQPLKSFIADYSEKSIALLQEKLTLMHFSTGYQGWIGIDSIIYKDGNDPLRIHPCLEINCRYTMGAVILALRKRINGESSGKFRILYSKEGSIDPYFRKMTDENPSLIRNEKITEGFLPLTPVDGNSRFGAFAIIKKK